MELILLGIERTMVYGYLMADAIRKFYHQWGVHSPQDIARFKGQSDGRLWILITLAGQLYLFNTASANTEDLSHVRA